MEALLLGSRRLELAGGGCLLSGDLRPQQPGVGFVADPLVLFATDGPDGALRWSLLPGGPSVTARADALTMLRGLSHGGELTFRLQGRDPLPPLHLTQEPWAADAEWRLFEDLATLEEWTGTALPVPETVSAEEATEAAQGAFWARTRRVKATIGESFQFRIREPIDELPDELSLNRAFGVTLFGVELNLGTGKSRVPLRSVRRLSSLEMAANPQTVDVEFELAPPLGRRLPAIRTSIGVPPRPHVGSSTDTVVADWLVARPATSSLAEVLTASDLPTRSEGSIAQLLDDLRAE